MHTIYNVLKSGFKIVLLQQYFTFTQSVWKGERKDARFFPQVYNEKPIIVFFIFVIAFASIETLNLFGPKFMKFINWHQHTRRLCYKVKIKSTKKIEFLYIFIGRSQFMSMS